MKKKLYAAIAVFIAILCLCSCKVDGKKIENNITVVAKSTAVFNRFKEKIPKLKFDNEPDEKYNDGFNYVLSVECSDKEYKNCLKKLKNSGFNVNPIEADTYYSASDSEGYFVEVTYVAGMLTLNIK